MFHAMAAETGLAGAEMDLVLDLPGGERFPLLEGVEAIGTAELAAALRAV